MIILFVILGLLALPGLRFTSFNKDYISIESTNAVKGLFAIIILFSHMNGYIVLQDNIYDNAFVSILRHLGQLMVAPYLFFSGYGILESAKKKEKYFDSFPRKRILKTLIHFDIAVFLYLLVNIFTDTNYPLSSYLTCWIGWESIGNSNWFIFVILSLYVATMISAIITNQIRREKETRLKLLAFFVSSLCAVLWIVLRLTRIGSWWYDTILTFPLGMFFSIFKNKFETLLSNRAKSWIILTSSSLVLVLWHLVFGNDQIGICACIFCITISTILTKVHIGNSVLSWLGTHAFAIYILQRLPMNIFKLVGWNQTPVLFALLSIPSALIIAWAYNKAIHALDTKLNF